MEVPQLHKDCDELSFDIPGVILNNHCVGVAL